MWLLLESDSGPLLLEEPELSLNEAIVRQLHAIFARLTLSRRNKRSRQFFISTHSAALLSNTGIPAESILLVTPVNEGSQVRAPKDHERTALLNGIPPSDLFLSDSMQFELAV